MNSEQKLDGILRIIDKFDSLFSLLGGVTEIRIRPSAKMILSAKLPTYVEFTCLGDTGFCLIKIPMQLLTNLADDPTIDKALANMFEKLIAANIQPDEKYHDYYYSIDKKEFVRLN